MQRRIARCFLTGCAHLKENCCPKGHRNTSTFNRFQKGFKPSTLLLLFSNICKPHWEVLLGYSAKFISTCNIYVNRLGSRVGSSCLDFCLCKFSVYPPIFVTDHHLCHRDWSEDNVLSLFFCYPPISVTDYHLCNRDCCEISLSIIFIFVTHYLCDRPPSLSQRLLCG